MSSLTPLYMLNAVDLRRATKAGSSRKTIISKLVVPSIKFKTASHAPGGSVMDVNFNQPRIDAPEPRFSVKGVDTDAFDGMGEIDEWVMAGAYTDKTNGRVVPSRVLLTGAISSFEPDESDPTEFQGCAYGFTEVTRIEMTLDNKQLFMADLFAGELIINGKDHFAAISNALGA